jgi:hypothetical protein
MIKRTTVLGVLLALVCLAARPAVAQDRETLLRAQADMLRKTLDKREQEIQQLKQQIAELKQRVAKLEAELGRYETVEPTTAPAPPTGTPAAAPRAPEPPALVAATQPADADYYGLSRLLRAIPPERMPGRESTPETRRQFTQWAQEQFGGKVLYAMYELQEARPAPGGGRLLIGQAPLASEQSDRKFFVTVAAEVSAEQYAANPLKKGNRAKLLGELPEQTPVEPIQATINDIQVERFYGRVISRREVRTEINGWSQDYAAVRVHMRRVRVLK